jgi:TolB-like protein/DNA-binding winged helix-turn-helix (wHTH) protein
VGKIRPTTGLPVRFGVFDLDPESGELRKAGVPLRLQPQPARVLALLAAHAGEVITREQLRGELWGEETYVDFEQGLNQCISQIRAALGDDADAPRYIQTVPRRGYRFIAQVEAVAAEDGAGRPDADVRAQSRRPRRRLWTIVAALLLLAGAAVLFWWPRGDAEIPRIGSIAVLPLENLSGDPEQEYFADGMTEELVTALGKVRALRVISRTSVMRYKRTKKPVPQIARELNVDALIEGTVTQSGGRVRLTTNLLHGPTDRHLWAETYDRDLSDVIELQRELARTVARQVRINLSPEDQQRLAAARPVNPEAHELYLKGQYHYYRWRAEEFEKAVSYFQRAIAVDPEYSLAYLGLAKTYGWQWIVGAIPPNEAFPKFRQALERALQIDDTVPEAHYVKAVAAWYFYWNWAEAEKEFKLALQLNPNLEEARFEYAWFLSTMGRKAEAVVEAERAVEIDPLSVSANLALGSIYHVAGRLDDALAQIRKTIELEPSDSRGYEFLSGVYKSLGLYDELVETRRREMQALRVEPAVVESMMEAYRTGGYAAFVRWQLARTKHPYRAAVLQAQLGMKDEAFASLEKAHQQRWWAMVRLNSFPEWEPLRSDPRFEALLRRMNFPR